MKATTSIELFRERPRRAEVSHNAYSSKSISVIEIGKDVEDEILDIRSNQRKIVLFLDNMVNTIRKNTSVALVADYYNPTA